MDHTHIEMVAVGQYASADVDLRNTLALTQAFVAVLLAERAGPLTPVQQDLLSTIQAHVSRLLVDE